MKSQIKKAAAVALAMTMCVPGAAWAADERATLTENSGSFETSFGVYSPALTVSVPLKASIEVNPMANTNDTPKTVRNYTVASNSIDIWNASVDLEADGGKGAGIPVNVTVQAAIAGKGEGVITVYGTLADDAKSTKKKIHLDLEEAKTPATMDLKPAGSDGSAAGAAAYVDGKFDLTQYVAKNSAVYGETTSPNKVPITASGSLLSVDIAGATLKSGGGDDYHTAGDVEPKVGSFAVTGNAYSNADWQPEDIQVDIVYNIKASKALTLTTPVLPAVTRASGADVVISLPDVGEATVVAVGLHNDEDYGDFVWAEDAYKIETVAGTPATMKITIDKAEETVTYLEEGHDGKAQDLFVTLSDGRTLVSTLTVNK